MLDTAGDSPACSERDSGPDQGGSEDRDRAFPAVEINNTSSAERYEHEYTHDLRHCSVIRDLPIKSMRSWAFRVSHVVSGHEQTS